jgi:hypothetical protein
MCLTQSNICSSNATLLLWSVIQASSDLYTPTSIANIFGIWLNGIDYKYIILLKGGAMALIWSLWLCRNDKKFNDKNCSILKVIYLCTRILRVWSPLHRLEDHDLFTEVCTRLEDAARYFFLGMVGSIIYGLARLLHRCLTLSHSDM